MQWIRDGQCLNTALLAGTEISGDLGQSALLVSVPQAYLEYTDSEWDPPSRWDDGIPGLIADYSINAQTRHENGGDDTNDISGNGTVGVNVGPWRLRADWQSDYQHTRSNDDGDTDDSGTQKLGVESLLRLARLAVIKSQTFAGRRLSQLRYF